MQCICFNSNNSIEVCKKAREKEKKMCVKYDTTPLRGMIDYNALHVFVYIKICPDDIPVQTLITFRARCSHFCGFSGNI